MLPAALHGNRLYFYRRLAFGFALRRGLISDIRLPSCVILRRRCRGINGIRSGIPSVLELGEYLFKTLFAIVYHTILLIIYRCIVYLNDILQNLRCQPKFVKKCGQLLRLLISLLFPIDSRK